MTVFNACIQDDSNPSSGIVFNTISGAYRASCGGVVVASGTGTITQQGCDFRLQHITANKKVTAKWSSVTFKGSGSVYVPAGALKCTIMDRNIANNTNCASLLLAQGVPLKVVSDILDHSQISTTADLYTHVLPSVRKEAIDLMNSILAGTN